MSNTIIYDGNEVINNHAICNFQHDKSRRSRRELVLGGGCAPGADLCFDDNYLCDGNESINN